MKKLLLISILALAVIAKAADQEQYIYGGGLDHPIQHWQFPDNTTMNATAGFFSQDIGKIALTTSSFYSLQTTTPTWNWMGGFPVAFSGSTFNIAAPVVLASDYLTAFQLRINANVGITSAAAGLAEINDTTPGNYRDLILRSVKFNALGFASLPASPTIGQVASINDGTAGLAWGATLTGGGVNATKYLVWWNGVNWTVVGK